MSVLGDHGLVLVSACLAGRACRYDGAAASHPAVLALVARGLAVPVCPEELGGLPTPREPMELCRGRVLGRSGADRTEAFVDGAREALNICRERGCVAAVLKARSPSCGCGHVYDGAFSGRLVPGDGVFAALLKAGGVPVRTEEDL
ncbi:MAG: purine-nucleoside phosphorylase [Desulfovibrionaceae bacterium CG1_02_65_16]|nr:MAG: purine-nucleoside phosphorylase [Desulfovibrionaceae bacterium CG1_02_65_16]